MNNEHNMVPVRVLGKPVEEEAQYVIAEPARQNKACGWVCPTCHKPVVICPAEAGEMYVTCRGCSTRTLITVEPDEEVDIVEEVLDESIVERVEEAPAEPIKEEAPAEAIVERVEEPAMPQEPAKPKFSQENVITFDIPMPTPTPPKAPKESLGQLSWGNIFLRKTHLLKLGTTIIGRNDANAPSDVEFKDGEMSRRSVQISVKALQDNQFSYELTVLKASNPVLVNNQRIEVGQTVELKDKSAITLGRTVINFKILTPKK